MISKFQTEILPGTIFIIINYTFAFLQQLPRCYSWRSDENKSPQISSAFHSVLINHNTNVIWIYLILAGVSNTSNLVSSATDMGPSAPVIGMLLIVMMFLLFLNERSWKFLMFRFLFFSHCHLLSHSHFKNFSLPH